MARGAPPFGVLLVGVTSAIVGAGLTVAALVLYVLKDALPYRWGFLLLAAVSAFGVYAALRLLRGRSARLLLIALLLGGLIDVVALIILPILLASTGPIPKFDDERTADPVGARSAATTSAGSVGWDAITSSRPGCSSPVRWRYAA